MSNNILYYSNYCDNCKKLLQVLSQSKLQEELHFICIDKRVTTSDGKIQIILKNGSSVILPPTITKVPALLLVNNGFHVLFGDQIYQHLQPKENKIQNKATNFQGEPDTYSFSTSTSCGIFSDEYSFFDMNADDLLAKGNGGLRQIHNYVTINDTGVTIETPPDNYSADKVDDNEMQKYVENRNK